LADWPLIASAPEATVPPKSLRRFDTDELSPHDASQRVPGLYFIGEAVDVTGWLGGYNFQWAWASGHACGAAL
jgi:hypothetical protein